MTWMNLPHGATPESHRLFNLGRRVILAHADRAEVACGMISGSTSEGLADELSDLDLIIHYETLPTEVELARIRESLGGGAVLTLGGSLADGAEVVQFRLENVDVQVVHSTVSHWEAEIDAMLTGADPASPTAKAMYGTLTSIAVVGDERLRLWQGKIGAYSDPLRRAMISRHIVLFPIWKHLPRLARRDADLWCRQALVDGSFKLLTVLAGVNGKYFTPFQFKRARAFAGGLTHSPDRLIDRLESLWSTDLSVSVQTLRQLAAETLDIVERTFPDIDTTSARRAIG